MWARQGAAGSSAFHDVKVYRRWLLFSAAWIILLAVLRHHSRLAWALDLAFVAGLGTAWLLTWLGRAKV